MFFMYTIDNKEILLTLEVLNCWSRNTEYTHIPYMQLKKIKLTNCQQQILLEQSEYILYSCSVLYLAFHHYQTFIKLILILLVPLHFATTMFITNSWTGTATLVKGKDCLE